MDGIIVVARTEPLPCEQWRRGKDNQGNFDSNTTIVFVIIVAAVAVIRPWIISGHVSGRGRRPENQQ